MPRHTSPRRGSQTGSISTQTEFSAYSYNGRQLRPCPDDTSLSALRASMNMEAHTPGEGDRPTRRRRVIKRVVLACALCRARKIRCSGKPADDAEDIRCERCIVNDVRHDLCDFQMLGITHSQSTRRRGSQAAKASQRLHGRSPIASREQGQQGDGNTSDHTLSFSSPSDLYGECPL